MPSFARHRIVARGEVGVYHCIARCVRRALLCGDDPLTGICFDHRKDWVQDRLEELAGIFAMDIGGFAVMSNHLHVIVRQRPDIAKKWSDEEVARRWWRLYPKRRDKQGKPAKPTDDDLAPLLADKEWIAERRDRLGNLSWFMRCLSEPIARRANREDECTGRFWEGRFKSQHLLDDAAVLACSIYVDLNPIRAGVASTPEESHHTSAFERIHARVAKKRSGKKAKRRRKKRSATHELPRDAWLAPMAAEKPKGAEQANRPDPSTAFARTTGCRASDEVLIPLDVDDYLKLLDWTGRQVRADKRGAIPAHLASIFDRLQISSSSWIGTVKNFGRWFGYAVGRAESVAKHALARGQQWFHGIRPCRRSFA